MSDKNDGIKRIIRRFLAEAPENQTYLRVPSIPSVAWQPYPSPLGRLRAHSFASPPHDGFAFVEDDLKRRPRRSVSSRLRHRSAGYTRNVERIFRMCKSYGFFSRHLNTERCAVFETC
jgi:hypothetical protein